MRGGHSPNSTLEAIGGGAGLVAAIKSELQQPAIEFELLLDRITIRMMPAVAIEVLEVPVADDDIFSRALRHEAAVGARLPAVLIA